MCLSRHYVVYHKYTYIYFSLLAQNQDNSFWKWKIKNSHLPLLVPWFWFLLLLTSVLFISSMSQPTPPCTWWYPWEGRQGCSPALSRGGVSSGCPHTEQVRWALGMQALPMPLTEMFTGQRPHSHEFALFARQGWVWNSQPPNRTGHLELFVLFVALCWLPVYFFFPPSTQQTTV